MNVPEKILVTMTSWHKRIDNVAPVVKTLLNQTIKPNKILLNFCTEDFPNMEGDLPNDLLELVKENDCIEIYWFIENYKAWKKHLHAIEIADDNTLIICTDDDHLYPEYFIEWLYVSYCYYGKKNPVTLNTTLVCHNLWSFNGPGTLYRKSDWKDYKKYLTHDILHNCWEDIFITILFALNNVMILPVIFHYPNDKDLLYNDIFAFSDPVVMKTTEEGKQIFNDMRMSTLHAMEDTFERNYFKGEETRYNPKFWNIVEDFLNKQIKEDPHPMEVKKYIFDKFKTSFLVPNFYDQDYKKLCIDLPRSSFREDYIGKDNRLIITLSSWPKRISNVVPVLKSILNNTILPTDILINLAKPDWNIPINDNAVTLDYLEEFYSEDFKELVQLARENPIIQLVWYDDSNLRSWKKHLYAINNYSENDVIICIDDDIIYSEVFIETMLRSYNYYGREFPITSITSSFCQGMFAFCGHSTLYRPGDFKNFNDYITPEILHMLPEDNHLLNILYINHKLLMPVIGRNFLFKDENFNPGDSNFGNNNFDDKWWNNYKQLMDEAAKIIDLKCSNREEMKLNWIPNCYNFSYASAKEFVEKYKTSWTEGFKKDVYDSIHAHVNSGFGNNMNTCLETLLDNKLV